MKIDSFTKSTSFNFVMKIFMIITKKKLIGCDEIKRLKVMLSIRRADEETIHRIVD
jgi:hypothetical protein